MGDKIIKLAKELISIPSITDDIHNAVEVMKVVEDCLKGYDYKPFVANSYPSLLYSNQGKNVKNFQVIFNGHLDVVPAGNEAFKPVEKNGRLYGRGAFDMKAAIAVKVLLFKEMAHKLSFPLALQLVSEEETSGRYGTGYQINQGVRGKFVVIGECTSNFKVGNKSKGRYIIRVSVKGKTSHSAYSWLGKNAIWRMYELLEPIVKAYPAARQETFKTTVNVTKIESSNSAVNIIPADCTAYLDIRYAPEDGKTIIPYLKSLLPADAIMEVDHARGYRSVDPKNKYIQLLKKNTKKVRGKETQLRYAHGTSDAVYYAEIGCDAVEFGPIGDNAHHENEWVDIQSLSDYYQILKNFLLEVDKAYVANRVKKKVVAKPLYNANYLKSTLRNSNGRV
jgi:succinyl-diaminopimelate desuccinylase